MTAYSMGNRVLPVKASKRGRAGISTPSFGASKRQGLRLAAGRAAVSRPQSSGNLARLHRDRDPSRSFSQASLNAPAYKEAFGSASREFADANAKSP
ncbi:MAG TPA: hypothetical protein VL202_12465, partial [Pararhizobium sp.]|uniref:hypothetical protein n=1 Tax=Pararhizobium sp. TaxID=1977563 RepID=UPI002C764BD3